MTISKNKLLRLLTIFLIFLFVSSVYGADPDHRKVVFIRYRIEPAYFATVVENFKKTMLMRGYIEGENIQYVDVLTRSADKESIPDVIEAVNEHKGSTDMFITCGWISMNAREILKGTEVPQLFVPVLESVATEMLQTVSAPPGTNLSGIYLMYPPEKILRIAKFIIPDIKNYAYVFDSRIPADSVFKKAYESLPHEKRYGITIHYIDLAEGMNNVLQHLKNLRIDGFGGIVGSFKNRKALASSNIPVITSFTLDIDQESLKNYLDDNTVAGLFNPFSYCGIEAAQMTADIFDGQNTIEKTLPRPAKQIAFINLPAAKRLNLPISFEVLEAVDVIIK